MVVQTRNPWVHLGHPQAGWWEGPWEGLATPPVFVSTAGRATWSRNSRQASPLSRARGVGTGYERRGMGTRGEGRCPQITYPEKLGAVWGA